MLNLVTQSIRFFKLQVYCAARREQPGVHEGEIICEFRLYTTVET
jgi:hypothetical protein